MSKGKDVEEGKAARPDRFICCTGVWRWLDGKRRDEGEEN